MKITSVNVELPREVTWKGKTVATGIFKEPVSERVML
jgi:MOSC domain-containing protein YiiM